MSGQHTPDRGREDRLQEMLDEARAVLDDLEQGVRVNPDPDEPDKPNQERSLNAFELLRRSRERTADGYPRSTIRGEGGPVSIVDDDNVPMPPLNDPVGELVVRDPQADPVRQAWKTLERRLAEAVADLRVARGALHSVAVVQPVEPDDEIWCSNHLRHRMFEPRGDKGRAGRCRWCYEWWLANREDCPKVILEARAQGKRITDRLVKDLLGRKATSQRPKAS